MDPFDTFTLRDAPVLRNYRDDVIMFQIIFKGSQGWEIFLGW